MASSSCARSRNENLCGHLLVAREQEVRLGYWTHIEFDWTGAIRTACELAAEHSLKIIVRGMDLFHVVIAIECGADAFLSFDDEQITLAEAAGLTVVRLPT